VTDAAAFRRATAADERACYVLFRHSIHDLLLRSGGFDPGTPPPDLDAFWPRQRAISAHLTATCSQWWLAEDDGGRPIGYARCIERESTVQLTEHFVAPDARVSGVGRGLLKRAFAPGASRSSSSCSGTAARRTSRSCSATARPRC
jgi:hypothetical protein